MSTPSQSTASHPPPDQPKQYNLRNPMPLSASQEQEVKQLYYKRVRGHCAAEIKAFAECAVNRTITATWVCRDQRLAMNGCMVAHAKPEEEDRAREEWFATFQDKRREREEKAREVAGRRDEVIRMMRADDERKAREKN